MEAPSSAPRSPDAPADRLTARRLWFWVVFAFVLLTALWTGLIWLALENQPAVIEAPAPP